MLLEDLPEPLLLRLLQFFPATDALSLQKTCRFTYAFIKANHGLLRKFSVCCIKKAQLFQEMERLWITWGSQGLYIRSEGQFFLPGKLFHFDEPSRMKGEADLVVSDSEVVVEGRRCDEERLDELRTSKISCRMAWDCSTSSEIIDGVGTLAQHILSRFNAAYVMIDVDEEVLFQLAPFLRNAPVVEFMRCRSEASIAAALEVMNVKRLKICSAGEERLQLSPNFFKLKTVRRLDGIQFDQHRMATGLDDANLFLGLNALRVGNFLTSKEVLKKVLKQWDEVPKIAVKKSYQAVVPREKCLKQEIQAKRKEFFDDLVFGLGGNRWDGPGNAQLTKKTDAGHISVFCMNWAEGGESFWKVKMACDPPPEIKEEEFEVRDD